MTFEPSISSLHKPRNLSQPQPGHRDWYSFEAIRALPRLLMMIDTNPLSKSYGSFDRPFWHYRTMDFPCGMSQEFTLALALAYQLDMPNNPYYKVQRLKELVEGAIRFADESAHKNKSCDDYYPYERALGALVFSLYSMTESCLELELDHSEDLDFFAKRADYLISRNESGQLANHQAFAALALYNVYLLTDDSKYLEGSNHYRDITLSWQKSEGWFQEYEGADPGYHTCSIDFLTKLWQKSQDEVLLAPLGRAVDFAYNFMHPDGSYAGEYGSRNTYHFYPHGFEVMSQFFPKAGQIAETFLQRAMPERRRYFNDDDRMAAHYVYDWMQAWRDYHPERQPVIELPEKTESTYFKEAKIFVIKTPIYHAVAAANKGGTFKAFAPSGPVESDTGLIGKLDSGKVVVTHKVDNNAKIEFDESENSLSVSGRFQSRKHPLFTPEKQIVFRVIVIVTGRLGINENVVRSFIQKLAITGKSMIPIRFKRQLKFADESIEVIDQVKIDSNEKADFEKLGAGSDATSIYVANSNVFQESRLLPWKWFDDKLAALNKKRRVKIKRNIKIPKQ